jgi:hypothetical protein
MHRRFSLQNIARSVARGVRFAMKENRSLRWLGGVCLLVLLLGALSCYRESSRITASIASYEGPCFENEAKVLLTVVDSNHQPAKQAQVWLLVPGYPQRRILSAKINGKYEIPHVPAVPGVQIEINVDCKTYQPVKEARHKVLLIDPTLVACQVTTIDVVLDCEAYEATV